jgi:hypothetical protein
MAVQYPADDHPKWAAISRYDGWYPFVSVQRAT